MSNKKILAGITAVAISAATVGSANAAIHSSNQAGIATIADRPTAGLDVADAGGSWFLNLLRPKPNVPTGRIPATGSISAPPAETARNGWDNWAADSWSMIGDPGSQDADFRHGIY